MVRKFFLTGMREIDGRYGNYGSDAEMCFQAQRSGKRVLLVPAVRAVHHGRGELNPSAGAARDADFKLGLAVYLRKRYGLMRSLWFRISAVLSALGGLLSFHDFRYHFALFSALLSGQKIDGTQAQ
jgi:GT2 family glycosyltransferase